jgi:hypothetical protein
MPAVPKTGQALFLGIELATDQLRATIVDESLELVGVECVDFDTELQEYQCVFLLILKSWQWLRVVQDNRWYLYDTGRGLYDASRDVD